MTLNIIESDTRSVIYIRDVKLSTKQWVYSQLRNLNLATISLLIAILIISQQTKNQVESLSNQNALAINNYNELTKLNYQSSQYIDLIKTFNGNLNDYNSQLQLANSNGLSNILNKGRVESIQTSVNIISDCSGVVYDTGCTLTVNNGTWMCFSEYYFNVNGNTGGSQYWINSILRDSNGANIPGSESAIGVFYVPPGQSSYTVKTNGLTVMTTPNNYVMRLFASRCVTGGGSQVGRIMCMLIK
jgi:hypothetical protein